MRKRLIGLVLAAAMIMLMVPTTVLAEDGTISASGTYDIGDYGNDSTITINAGLTVTLTNINNEGYSNVQIMCGVGTTLTLDNVRLYSSKYDGKCPLTFAGSGNTLNIVGVCHMYGSDKEPGIKVENGTSLEIFGAGSVWAVAGDSAAGIGSGYQNDCGDIIISGGYIFVDGSVQDIGCGVDGSGGTLTISNGAIIFLEDGTTIPPTTTHTKSKHNINEGSSVYGIEVPNKSGIIYYSYINFNYVFDLSYDANGGMGEVPGTVSQFNDTVTTINGSDVLTKGTQIFSGWNTREDGLGAVYTPGDVFTFSADTTLYAMYEDVFTQGDGTDEKPYGVSTPKQLNAVRYFPKAHYVMLNDIDMTAATAEGGAYYNYGQGFAPIPNYDGTFNGNGYKIIGLKIHRVREDQIGLFGVALSNSVITNLGMVDSDIYGGYRGAGGICGRSLGKIQYCYNAGNVSGGDYGATGGIAGSAVDVSNCYNVGHIQMVDVPGSGSSGCAGGILGGGTAVNCYNAGTVEGYPDASVGGIVGSTSKTTNCYNVGSVLGNPAIGKLSQSVEKVKLDGIYYIKVNDYVLGVGDGNFTSFDEEFDYATQLTNEEMKLEVSYERFDFDNVWTMNGDSGYPYPELQGLPQISIPENTTDFDGGNGLPYSPYEISTVDQLNNIRNHLHGSFVLLNDIDMTVATSTDGKYYNDGKGFKPIGMDDNSYFVGSFDGKGHKIIGFTSIYPDEFVGLFDLCYYSLVKNLGIVDINIFGERVGSITGSSFNTQIQDCYVTGRIKSTDNSLHCAGGIAGSVSDGGIQRCYSSIEITNPYFYSGFTYSLGGVVGEVCRSDVSMCYFSGSIIELDSDTTMGGIAGRSDGNIVDCFNTGYLENPSDIKERGIVGFNEGSVERCYNTNSASDPIGYCTESGSFLDCYYLQRPQNSGKTILGATSITCDELTQQFTYDNFDFTNVWIIIENESPPVLRGLPFKYTNGIILDRDQTIIGISESLSLSVTVSPANATDKTVIWSSSDDSIATVEDGVITGKSEGTATITSRTLYGNFEDTCVVSVGGESVTDVILNWKQKTVTLGDTFTLTATVEPDDATNPEVTWSTSDQTVATVDQTGKVTAESIGSAIITATADGVSDTCQVTVSKKAVTSVEISSNEETVRPGDMFTLTATVRPSDATFHEVIWSTSDEGVATVDQTGKVKAVGVGSTTITATADGISDTCTVTVITEKNEVIDGQLHRIYFNEDGSIHREVIYYGMDDTSIIQKINYYADGVRKSYKLFDTSGNLKNLVELYSSGKIKKINYYNTTTGYRYAYKLYDTAGRMKNYIYCYMDGTKPKKTNYYNTSTGVRKSYKLYDTQGRTTRYAFCYSNGVKARKMNYYNVNTGKRSAYKTYRRDGSCSCYTKCDSNGNPTVATYFDKNGKVIKVVHY